MARGIRAFRLGLIGLCLAGLLGGCAAVDSSVAPRYNTISRNFAAARNGLILLNIVRAAHHDPLTFAAITKATPNFNNGANVGLPGFSVGPGTSSVVGFSEKVVSASASASTEFDLAPQDEKNFYNGLLHPVDLHVVKYFILQGYPRELLFWLFAQRVQVQFGRTSVGYEYNSVYHYGCPLRRVPDRRCFRDWAEIAAIAGLTVEEKPAPSSRKNNGKGGGDTYDRVCFNPVLARQGKAAMDKYTPGLWRHLVDKYLEGGRLFHTLSPLCGTPWKTKPSQQDTLDFSVNHIPFEIVPRSSYGIYQFLGELVHQQMSGEPIVAPRGYSKQQVEPDLTTTQDRHIIDLVRDGGPDCFVSTHFYDGDYCVPRTAYNTKRIIGLLAALTALQTSPIDLPFTPTVHVAGQ